MSKVDLGSRLGGPLGVPQFVHFVPAWDRGQTSSSRAEAGSPGPAARGGREPIQVTALAGGESSTWLQSSSGPRVLCRQRASRVLEAQPCRSFAFPALNVVY